MVRRFLIKKCLKLHFNLKINNTLFVISKLLICHWAYDWPVINGVRMNHILIGSPDIVHLRYSLYSYLKNILN